MRFRCRFETVGTRRDLRVYREAMGIVTHDRCTVQNSAPEGQHGEQ